MISIATVLFCNESLKIVNFVRHANLKVYIIHNSKNINEIYILLCKRILRILFFLITCSADYKS